MISTDELQKLLDAATPGPWSGHNMVHADGNRPMTPEEIGEYVCNAVKVGSPDRFLFVNGRHDDGGDADVCHTGNGPRGLANTALIAAAPDLAAELIAARAKIAAAEALAEAARRLSDYSRQHTNLGDQWVLSQADLENLERTLAAWEASQ